jgi:hypothetical protein
MSLDHVFFSRYKRGAELKTDAESAAVALKASPDAAVGADPFPRGNQLSDHTPSMMVRSFGAAFAEQVSVLPVGEWHGPVESSYGLHVVRVIDRIDEAPPSLEAVRERARADWIYDQRKQLNRQAVEAIIDRYAGEEDPDP